jgi:putative peptidoglycan lipid II flippase
MSLLYGNGRAASNPAHVPGCAVALQTYAIGLVFYSGLKVLQPAFYAIDKRFIPMIVSLVCVLFSAALNYLFVIHWHLDHRYLALSTSLSAALNFGCLFFAMRHHAGRFGGRKLVITFGKLLVAAACMAVVCWTAQLTLLAHWNDHNIIVRSVLLGLTIAIAAAAYFGVSAILKNEELGDFTGSLKRKLGGPKPS